MGENIEEYKMALKYLAYNLAADERPMHHSYEAKLRRFAFEVLSGKSCEEAERSCDLD